jgi:hypothetical protein
MLGDPSGITIPAGFSFPSACGVLTCPAAYNEKLRALPCSRECFAGAAAGVRSKRNLFYYIFRIVTYRRISGSDLTAASPSAAATAAVVIVVTYPIVRIIFLLLVRESATAARDIDVPQACLPR